MTPLIPIMLFGWVPFTVFLFFRLPPHRAVIVSVIGGWLLLPMAGYDLPGIPQYDKAGAIALGLILGGRLSGQRWKAGFKWKLYDLPMVLWCLSPIPTSLTNQLGMYEGLSGVYGQIMVWGIPYLAGRTYFCKQEALRDLCTGIVAWSVLYAALCLYEIRMSPRLSINIYGYFPHEWLQHKRYGGWRPIVFMQHGLMVAVWMAAAASAAFWLWRSQTVERIKGIPMGLVVALLVITALLCKSASGWVTLSIGCGGYFTYRWWRGNFLFILLLLIVPLYIGVRVSNTVSKEDVEVLSSKVFDADRTNSLAIRLQQENLFVVKALERPLFGWGGHSRGWPVDPLTGERLTRQVDSLWTIIFSTKGFFGISNWIIAMLFGPWVILRTTTRKSSKDEGSEAMAPVLLSLIVILFMLDSLFNAMVNPIYIMCSGALVGRYLTEKRDHLLSSSLKNLNRSNSTKE